MEYFLSNQYIQIEYRERQQEKENNNVEATATPKTGEQTIQLVCDADIPEILESALEPYLKQRQL